MLTCMPWNFLDRCDATKIVVLWKLLNVPEFFVNIYIYIYIYNFFLNFSKESSYRIFQNNSWTPSIRKT